MREIIRAQAGAASVIPVKHFTLILIACTIRPGRTGSPFHPKPMKRFLISALLLMLGTAFFTSCQSTTTHPREKPNATATETSSSRTYSK